MVYASGGSMRCLDKVVGAPGVEGNERHKTCKTLFGINPARQHRNTSAPMERVAISLADWAL